MSKEQATGDLLREHGLKKTAIRTKILDIFLKHDFALSAMDILAAMPQGQDKVTVYRALASFEEKGLIHRASEDSSGVKYAICSHHCPQETHAESHAHFVCNECRNTYCLEEVKVPEIKVKGDFAIQQAHYTLSGICSHCRAS